MASPAVSAFSVPWRHRAGTTVVHRTSPRVKLVAVIVFAVIVVATPREWFVAYAGYAAVLVSLLAVARIPVGTVLRRMTIEIPFLVFALLMPLIATGERIDVFGMSLSVAGLWAAWGLLAKATLALLAAVLLVTTTEPRRIVLALESLRLPRVMISIMGFMLRYLDLIADESRRMAIARAARGFSARSPRSWRVLAQAVGALFVRAHARGERVHLAMLARGYSEQGAPKQDVPERETPEQGTPGRGVPGPKASEQGVLEQSR
ncbi:cobalt ECF transporter T component CbiQ [Microbacterium luticocti]|uniref:cobalt ECF transporter T component CbiQ n=1 Tax=Microbacterium luticocti TaxID=451764 RepID=UPI000413788B|nr:cobalt ECF transporter T component CbiQ [Microbacterium luticocti]